jgi:hypothetical protein
VAAASGGKAATAAAGPLVWYGEAVGADGHMQVGVLLLVLHLQQKVEEPVIQVFDIHTINVVKTKVLQVLYMNGLG